VKEPIKVDVGGNVMLAPKLAAILALVGFVCLLLSAFLGVSHLADWLVDGSEGLLVAAAVIFLGYFVAGVISDARAL
jgi:hypothetical protein